MSSWVYINGTITVSPIGCTQAQKRYILDTVLAHLPIVSGSEKDMDVYVIQKNGHNSSCSHDEFGISKERIMLIRSQDRTKLVDITGKTIVVSGVNDIKISYVSSAKLGHYTNKEIAIKILDANSSVRLGRYTSKEKAIKVLDMIQESCIDCHIDFQMPQDEEV